MSIRVASLTLLIIAVLFLAGCPITATPDSGGGDDGAGSSKYTLSGTLTRSDVLNATAYVKVMPKGGAINDSATYSTTTVLSNGINPYYNSYSISEIAGGEYTVWTFIDAVTVNGQWDNGEPKKSRDIDFASDESWDVSSWD